MKGAMVDYISAHIPEISDELRGDWDVLDDNSYYPVSCLYNFAVRQYQIRNFEILRRVFALVELALSSGEDQLVNPFAIEIYENLESNAQSDYYKDFVRLLGPNSLAGFKNRPAFEAVPGKVCKSGASGVA